MGRARGLSALAEATGAAQRRRGGPPRHWTEERLEAELRRFVAGRDYWPTYQEFVDAGRVDLRTAVSRAGGHELWASRLGWSLARRWTAEKLEAALREFIGERPGWPTAPEFVSAGRIDLRDAVKRHGGAVEWARRLGKELRPGQDRTPYEESDAVADAREIVRLRGSLPSQRVIRALGYPRLASFLQHRYPGGVRRFRADLATSDTSAPVV
jgi:hypothetical protein